MVKLDSTRINYAHTQNSGQDLRFTDSDGTTALSYEIEKWDESGISIAWVKVPQIDASSNTDYIYMYYGNTGATDAQSPSSVWGDTARFHLNETTTTDTNQFKGSGYYDTGKLNQAVSMYGNAAGTQGSKLTFNSGAQISGNNYERINMNQGTISFWVKPSWAGNVADNRIHYFFADGGSAYFRIFKHNAWSRIFFYYGNNQAVYIDVSGWAANSWHHLTLRYDIDNPVSGSNYAEVYVDGLLSSYNTNAVTAAPVSSTLSIGSDYSGGNNADALIDDFAIFDRVLTTTEISNLYNSGTGREAGYVADPSLKFYAKLDGSGTLSPVTTAAGASFDQTAYDSSTNTNGNMVTNGTFESATSGSPTGWSSYSTPTLEDAESSNILFDARSQKITASGADQGIRQTINVSQNTTYTLSLWAKGGSVAPYLYVSGDVSGYGLVNLYSMSSTSWTKYDVTFKTSTDTIVRVDVRGSNGDFYVDNVHLTPNLVNNGGMEGTYTGGYAPGWNNFGTPSSVSEETTIKHSGTKSQKIVTSGNLQGINTISSFFATSNQYLVSFWVYGTGGSIRASSSNGKVIYSGTPTANTWVKISKIYSVNNGASGYLYIASNDNATTFYIDDVSVVPLDNISTSFQSWTPVDEKTGNANDLSVHGDSDGVASNATSQIGNGYTFDGSTGFLRQKTYDTNVGTLSYSSNNIVDSGQNFDDWDNDDGGGAEYMTVVTNSDNTTSWGYLCSNASSTTQATVYTEKDCTSGANGFNGTSPTGKTPVGYEIRKTDFQISTESLSVGGWIKLNSVSGNYVPISKGDFATTATNSYNITYFGSTTGFNFITYSGFSNVNSMVGTPNANAGEWYQVIGVFDNAANIQRLYVNGVEQDSDTRNGDLNVQPESLLVGGRLSGGVMGAYMNGGLDEMFVKSSAMTAPQIAATYKSESDTFNTYASEEAYYSTGTLTSSIFDTGLTGATVWGNLTYTVTTPGGSTLSVKARTSNSSSMTGADDFFTCDAITSGSDMSTNNCITDGERYIQYYVTFANTDGVSTPTLNDISLAFTSSDSTAPSISLTALTPDPTNDNTPALSGTATEAVGTVTAVQFQTDSTGGSWTVCTATDGAFDEASETFTCTVSSSLSDGSHTMNVRATDSNGNTTADGSVTTDTFTVDVTAPTTPGTPSTTSPTSDTTPTWTWTASTDATSGLASNPYTIEWSQSSSFSSGVSSDTSTTNSFTHITPLTDGTWYFRVKATDQAGNDSSVSSNGSVQINTGAPVGSIKINADDAYTRTRDVTLTISASSGFFSSTDDIQMKIGNLPDLSDGTYEAFAGTKSWTLTSGDGTKTVYVQFKDATNNESGAYTDTIVFDATAPNEFDLQEPGNNTYTSSERSTFKWKAASTGDATSGLSKYKLEVDNGESGDFTIDDIPTSRTTTYEALKYEIRYENFTDSDNTNNYISVITRSSITWGSDHNDGKLKEGKRNWKVIAYDNAGNTRDEARTLFVDYSGPRVEVIQLNDNKVITNTYSTSDKTPTIFGKITDTLSGNTDSASEQVRNDNRVVSGPKSVEVTIEKKNRNSYDVHTLATVNLNGTYWSKDGSKITDNTLQTSDKYSTFEFTPETQLPLGTYRIKIKGKDTAGNTGSEVIVNLSVTTFAEVATPEEKEAIEEVLEKEFPTATEEQKEKLEEEVSKDLEVTKAEEPKGPSLIEKAGSGIAQKTSNAAKATSGFIANTAGQAWNGTKVVVSTVWTGVTFVAQKTGEGITYIFNGAKQGVIALGKGIGSVARSVGQGVSTIATNIGNSYNTLAQNAPGVIGDGMEAVGNGVKAAADGIGTVASNVGNGIKNTGTAIAQGVGNATKATKEGVANVAFFVGEKADGVSNSVSVAIVKFGYLFATEPTKIADVNAEVLSPTSVKITWKTNHPANGKVNWGYESGVYTFEEQTDKRTTDHEFILTNLKPETEYHYEVMSQNKNYVYDANRTFRTPEEK